MDDIAKGFSVACRLLGHAPLLEKQLREKLSKRQFGKQVVEVVIDKCRGYGYLNDDELIAKYIEREFRKGRGPHLIAHKVREKAGRSYDELIAALIPPERERERIEELLAEGLDLPKLYRRGFTINS